MCDSEKTQISKECIENWMRFNGLTYSMIASQCRITECIVLKWVSQKDIPRSSKETLDRFFYSFNRVNFVGGNQEDGLKLELSLSDYGKLSTKALEAGCSVGELIARKLDSMSKNS